MSHNVERTSSFRPQPRSTGPVPAKTESAEERSPVGEGAQDSGTTAKPRKPKYQRLTCYATKKALEHLDDQLYFARKRGDTEIRDRTHVIRAFLEACSRAGWGLGGALTEEDLTSMLVERLRR